MSEHPLAKCYIVTYQDKDFSVSRKEWPVKDPNDWISARDAAWKFYIACQDTPEVSQARLTIQQEHVIDEWAR